MGLNQPSVVVRRGRLPHRLGRWKEVFKRLHDVRLWGVGIGEPLLPQPEELPDACPRVRLARARGERPSEILARVSNRSKNECFGERGLADARRSNEEQAIR